MGAQGCAEEAKVAHFHETVWQNMLEETLDEVLHGKGTGLELSGIGGAVLEGELGSLQTATVINGDQTPVAEGNAVDVGSQVFESSLPIADWFAMHNPFSLPDCWGNLCVECGFAQGALESSSE